MSCYRPDKRGVSHHCESSYAASNDPSGKTLCHIGNKRGSSLPCAILHACEATAECQILCRTENIESCITLSTLLTYIALIVAIRTNQTVYRRSRSDHRIFME
ncbi:hypothetical protein M514_01910 [Trichuris suis]|uniref:Uncharacterized protein n=1 Tax=Trichuris suis TaxID=68888 RepID=A0A085MJK3_9BILA|nr:hypothetical protein M513_01910 [Trichuris suis]KFD72788.1 hypothetical protein M514_01910 [Trichuris suis]